VFVYKHKEAAYTIIDKDLIGNTHLRITTGRGWGKGGEMTQTLYAHMSKIIKKKNYHRFFFYVFGETNKIYFYGLDLKYLPKQFMC
jgi:hypothetical protein